MINILAFSGVVLMLFWYIWTARSSYIKNKHNDPDRFFLSTHAHSKEEYGSAQIAYFLQMATVYPFFIFGFTGWWWLGIWNTVFFAVGIVLFVLILPRCSSGTLDLIGKSSTPHALIAKAHKAPMLRTFASCLSIMAFIGLALFETVWGASVLKTIFGGSTYLYYLSIGILALYLVAFLWTGGQRAAIKADQYQLLIAYIGLHLLLGWSLLEHDNMMNQVQAPFIFLLIVIFGSIAVYKRIQNIHQDGTFGMKILNILAILSLLVVLVSICITPNFLKSLSFSVSPISFPPETPWMLITMAVMPIFFQFVDMTNWQRLSSVSGESNGVMKDALFGLKQFLLESPLSWLFPIAIGMSAALFITVPGEADPWMTFLDHVIDRKGLYGLVPIATVLGVVCIFLSTANALLCASGYAYAYDIHPKSRKLMDSLHESISPLPISDSDSFTVVHAGKFVASIAIMGAALFYIIFDMLSPNLGAGLLGIFLSFYSPMLSFAPSMLVPILTGRAAHPGVAFASMSIAASLGLALGVFSVFSSNLIWQWVGVPICFGTSWVIYLVGFFVHSRAVNGEPLTAVR